MRAKTENFVHDVVNVNEMLVHSIQKRKGSHNSSRAQVLQESTEVPMSTRENILSRDQGDWKMPPKFKRKDSRHGTAEKENPPPQLKQVFVSPPESAAVTKGIEDEIRSFHVKYDSLMNDIANTRA